MAADEIRQGEVVTIENVPHGEGQVGGRIQMSADVVATIAGLAARQIPGIRAGRSRLFGFGDRPKHGIDAEVGQKEAALDLEIIIDYGTDIRAVASELRAKIARDVDRMAGRKVVEINLRVVGIQLPEDRPAEPTSPRRRVE